MRPPIQDIETYWRPDEKAAAQQMLGCSIVGGPETIRRGVAAFLERTRADELMIVSDVYDFANRLRSFELIVEALR